MADYNLGTARGTIELGYKGDGPQRAAKDLDQVGRQGQTTAQKLNGVARASLIAGAAIAGGIAVAVNSAANFEQRMSAIGAVSGANSKELEQLSQKALQLGKDTQFSASEAAGAMEELVKAGLKTEDVLNGAADATVALAAAGELDMPTAATIASNAMNQFQLSAKELPKVADLLAGAANASAISVRDIGESLAYVGPVAQATGVSIEDVSTALAILGNRGVKGSAAGTALRSILTGLVPTTKKATTQFKELGLITENGTNMFVDANGAIKPLNQVMQILNDKTAHLSKTEKNTFAKKAFGLETLSSVSILASQTGASFDKMAGDIGKVTAAEVAAKKMDNLKGSIEEMKGSLETAAIQMGTALIPALRAIVDTITVVVNAFSNLSPGAQQAVLAIIALTGAMLLSIGAFIKIVQFAQAAKNAFLVLKASALFGPVIAKLGAAFKIAAAGAKAFTVALLTNPIFLIIAAIVALVAIFVILYKKNETFRNAVNAAWEGIKTAVGAVVAWFMGTALPIIMGVWNAIVAGVMFMVTIVKTVLMAFLAYWMALWNFFGPIVMAVWELIKQIIRIAILVIVILVITQIKILLAVWSAVWGLIVAVATTVWEFIKAAVKAGIAIVVGLFGGPLKKLISLWTAVWNFFKPYVTAAWNQIKSAVSSGIGTVVGLVTGFGTKVLKPVLDLASKFFNAGKALMTAIRDGIVDGINAAVDAAKEAADRLAEYVPGSPVREGPLKVLNQGYAGKQIMRMLADGINKEAPALAVAMEQATKLDLVPNGQNLGNVAKEAAKTLSSADSTRFAVESSAKQAAANTALRVIGTLDLTSRSSATIKGLASEVIESDDEFEAVLARMGKAS